MISVSALPLGAVFGDSDCGLSRSIALAAVYPEQGKDGPLLRLREAPPPHPYPWERRSPTESWGFPGKSCQVAVVPSIQKPEL